MILRARTSPIRPRALQALLTAQAAALYPQTSTKCLPALEQPASFGGLAPSQIFKPGADLAPLIAALNANDPEDLTIKTPVQIEQGLADTTVFPGFTQQLDDEYNQHDVKVTYKTYKGVDARRRRDRGRRPTPPAWIKGRLP